MLNEHIAWCATSLYITFDHLRILRAKCYGVDDTTAYEHASLIKRTTLTWRSESLRLEELDAYATCTK